MALFSDAKGKVGAKIRKAKRKGRKGRKKGGIFSNMDKARKKKSRGRPDDHANDKAEKEDKRPDWLKKLKPLKGTKKKGGK